MSNDDEETRTPNVEPEEGKGFETGTQVNSDDPISAGRGEVSDTPKDLDSEPEDEPAADDDEEGEGFETEVNPLGDPEKEGFETGHEIKGPKDEKVTGFAREGFELHRQA